MLTVRSLTGGEKEGSGVFDELMRTIKSHVHQELEEGRISEKAYSEVYLGALQFALNSATNYALAYEKANKELAVLDEQIKQNQKQNELLELQKEQLRLANTTAQYNLSYTLPEQLIQIKKQNEKLIGEINHVTSQTSHVSAQTALVVKQEDLVDEQIRDAKDKYTNPIGGINKAQYDKLIAEKGIADQKLITEKAQTMDTVNGTAITGLVGKERSLKQNQADSFLRNAEIQVAKLYSDTFAVMYSTEAEGMSNQKWGFGADESFEVMKKAAKGVGADTGFDIDAQD